MGPNDVRGKQSLFACFIDTCGKKIQSQNNYANSKRCSAPYSKIANFSCEGWRRLLAKEKKDSLV